MRRAMAAKRYLTEHGVASDRLETVSYGKERPLDPGHDETAWAKNRRDQFAIIAGVESLNPKIAMQ
jgi:peptidoglycan-associated lipoprotein